LVQVTDSSWTIFYEPEGREFESLRAHHLSQGRKPPALGS
jgi:hypothetical protein